jgi:hypothetical protein
MQNLFGRAISASSPHPKSRISSEQVLTKARPFADRGRPPGAGHAPQRPPAARADSSAEEHHFLHFVLDLREMAERSWTATDNGSSIGSLCLHVVVPLAERRQVSVVGRWNCTGKDWNKFSRGNYRRNSKNI